MTAPCAGCFLRLIQAKKRMDEDVSLEKEIEEILGRQYWGTAKVYHPLTVFSQEGIKEKIQRSIVNTLKDLKVVCYYGCFVVRPPEITRLDDPENPTVMDELIKLTGAEVLDWAWKVDCCGGSHALLAPELVELLVNGIADGAHKAGAHAIVTACPLCQYNLGDRQDEVKKIFRDFESIPVVYYTQLMALAFGLDGEAMGFDQNHPDPRPVLEERGLI